MRASPLLSIAVLLSATLAVAPAQADPLENIINQVTLAQYQSYLRVLTGVDPVPGTGGVHLANRWSHGADILLAADWIRDEFVSYGLDASLHNYDPSYAPNVIGELPGTTRPDDIYIICAHYDTHHAANQLTAPGCDDNGSGTAAVMTAAYVLSQYEFEGTIRFIAFSGEEQWMVGSLAYCAAARAAGENIVGAINLDMILHPSFDNRDPDPDHDLDIGANGASQGMAQEVASIFTTHLSIDVQVHNDPSFVSDQWSFWQHGYVAVGLLENTVNEIWGGSNNSYHQTTDVMTNPHIEWDFAREAAAGAAASLANLAGLLGCTGDLDGDGDTDLADLGILLADFGCTGGSCPGDLDGDGDTDLEDLGILLGDFGCGR